VHFHQISKQNLPRPGMEVRLMLPSSVVCWQTIDKELFVDDTLCTGVRLYNDNKYVTNIEQSSSISKNPRHCNVLSSNKWWAYSRWSRKRYKKFPKKIQVFWSSSQCVYKLG